MGRELFGGSLGLLGFGLIDRRVAELVEPFTVDVQVYDPFIDNASIPAGVERVGLDTLLESSEFVSLHCTLTDETEGLLDADAFRRMRADALLVNTARGGIYADADLARALRDDRIAGAAIDVFEGEPWIGENPLVDLETRLLTLHVAGVTTDSFDRIGALLYQSVETVLGGGVPRNVINPETVDVQVPLEKHSPSFIETRQPWPQW